MYTVKSVESMRQMRCPSYSLDNIKGDPLMVLLWASVMHNSTKHRIQVYNDQQLEVIVVAMVQAS